MSDETPKPAVQSPAKLPAAPKPSWRSYVAPVIGGLLGLSVLAFVIQNRPAQKVTWLFWSFSAPLWILLLLTAVVAVVAWHLGIFAWKRHERREARARK
jgi:uncharacterized integral membrane protein